MVDVGSKQDTMRVATASGRVLLGQEAFALVRDNKMAKGDVLPTAELAGECVPALAASLIMSTIVQSLSGACICGQAEE